MKKRILKAAALTLALLLSLSSAGCGKEEALTVDKNDYGNGVASDSSFGAPVNAEYVDAEYIENSIIDYQLKINDSIMNGDRIVNIDIDDEEKIEVNDLKVYLLSTMDEFSEIEDALLDSLFGGSYNRLEHISYSENANYMPLVLKYRDLIDKFNVKFGKTPDTSGSDSLIIYQFVSNYKPLSKDSFTDSYEWVDDENFYIHMYEGDIGSNRFGLILAYDKVDKIRYIFLKPSNINQYFPGRDIKCLRLNNPYDAAGNPDRRKNVCELPEDEVEEKMRTFLTDSLKMHSPEIELGNDYKLYSKVCQPFLGSISGLTLGTENAAEGVSRLIFSSKDYVETIYTYAPDFEYDTNNPEGRADFFPRSVEILAPQDDRLAETVKKGTSFEEALLDPTGENNDLLFEDISDEDYYIDGYALYLNPSFQKHYETNEWIEIYDEKTPANAGVIEFTSKGIFGVDIVQMISITDLEDCKLVTPDTVKESLINVLSNAEFPEEIADSDVIKISDVIFGYYVTDELENVPAWIFSLKGNKNNYEPTLAINAATGGLVRFE